jgi:hypothetical protein
MRKIRMIKYWFKIMSNTDSLMYILFMKHDFNGNSVNKWSKHVKNILDETGFSYLWNNSFVTNLQIQCVIKSIYDLYIQQFYSELRYSPKLETYCLIKKDDFCTEKYLSSISNVNHRIALSRIR